MLHRHWRDLPRATHPPQLNLLPKKANSAAITMTGWLAHLLVLVIAKNTLSVK